MFPVCKNFCFEPYYLARNEERERKTCGYDGAGSGDNSGDYENDGSDGSGEPDFITEESNQKDPEKTTTKPVTPKAEISESITIAPYTSKALEKSQDFAGKCPFNLMCVDHKPPTPFVKAKLEPICNRRG